jgi:hypothetical protein
MPMFTLIAHDAEGLAVGLGVGVIQAGLLRSAFTMAQPMMCV